MYRFAFLVPWVMLLACSTVRGEQGSVEKIVSRASGIELRVRTTADLQYQLQDWLERIWQQEGLEVTAEPLGIWGWLDSSPTHLRAELVQRRQFGNNWHVAVVLKSLEAAVPGAPDETKASAVPTASFRLVAQHKVWVAAVPMRKGDRPTCGQLVQERRPVRAGKLVWSKDCEQLAALELRRPLEPGDVLLNTDVAPPRAVSGQQPVMVVTQTGGIEIRAAGLALADAQVGQIVPVRLNGQLAVVQAVVTAPGTVQVLGGTR